MLKQLISQSKLHLTFVAICFIFSAQLAFAQNTAFTYQGKLTDAGNPANGSYDLQFKLFDALAGGTQQGATLVRNPVTVSAGVFNITLDFGANVFSGADRYLEIGVRPAGSGNAYTVLSPRQPITSSPYAIQTLNAQQLGGIPASGYLQTVTHEAALSGNGTSGSPLGLAASGVGTTELGANAVTTAKLADGSVTNIKIVDVAGSKLTGAITTATIPGANVTGAVANATNAMTATNATNATTAVNFSGALAGDVTGNQGAVTVAKLQGRMVANTAPASGQVLKFNSITNQWEPNTDNTSAGGGGTITGVTAGIGLSGGGASGTVTVGIAPGGVSSTELATNAVTTAKLADANVTNAKIVDVAGSKVTGSLTSATIPGTNVTSAVANATNAVNATNATNAVNATNATTAVNFSGGLAGDVTGNQGTTTVAKLRNLPLPTPVLADNGKVLSYKNDGVNPASFELATMSSGGGTITGVTAGTGLSGGGTTGTVTVGIAAGGVGANELATNGVTTAKLLDGSVTDAKIATVAGSKVTGAIPLASVPAGSTNYIQNTLTLQASSNFNISGNGTAGSLNANGPVSLGGIAAPAMAPAGQGRIYFDTATNKVKVSENGAAFVNLVGATGVSGSGTTNTIPLWSAGTTLGDSLITQSAGTVQLPNGIGLATGAQGNRVQFGSPSGETGMSISGTSGRADIRFDNLGTLKLVATTPGLVPPNTNGIAIDSAGNVGIGTTTPVQKLHVDGTEIFSTGVLAGFKFRDRGSLSNTDNWVWYSQNNVARLFRQSAGTDLLSVTASGNVGIGTTTPEHRLSVTTSSTQSSAIYGVNTNALQFTLPAIHGRGTGGNGVEGFSVMGNGVAGVSGSPTQAGIYAGNTGGGRALFVDDNAGQSLSGNGFVKAMAMITYNGDNPATITRCYNGFTNSSSGNCGFILTDYIQDDFGILYSHATINFGVTINDRFISVTPVENRHDAKAHVWSYPNSTTVDVQSNANFYILVF